MELILNRKGAAAKPLLFALLLVAALWLLKNAPSEQVKQKIIESRIAHLEKEIQTFYTNIIKILN